MGQSSSPIINKLGLTMFWGNMWDDKVNFSRKLREDILINMFLFLIFTGCLYNCSFFYKFHKNYILQSFFVFHKFSIKFNFNNFVKFDRTKELRLYKPTKLKSKIHYIGKVWILRFCGWLIISFYLYIPSKNKLGDFTNSFGDFFSKKISKKNSLITQKKSNQPITNIFYKNKEAWLFFNWYQYNNNSLKLKKFSYLNPNQPILLNFSF